MRGVGSASGAITIVNALPTGVGASAAVRLTARATIDLEPRSTTTESPELVVLGGPRSALLLAAYEAGLHSFADGMGWSGRLTVASELPVAKGLKSSSAVSVAVLRAIASALGRPADDAEVARMSADLTQRIGLSATGAFDDALACSAGGVRVTDNGARRLLRTDDLPSSLHVLIWVPPGEHAASRDWHEAFRQRAADGRRAAEAARTGHFFEAMEENTRLVEAVMGYGYSTLREELRSAGIVGAGVSGMGPAVAAVVTPSKLEEGRAVLARAGGRILTTTFRPAGEEAGAAA